MRKLERFGIGWSVFLAAALSVVTSARAGEGSDPKLRILVRVYNYARIPNPVLAKAEREAARVFSKAGVELDWLDCPLVAAEEQPVAVCQQLPSPIEVVLRILSSTKKGKLRLRATVFGFAVPPVGAGHGFLASVYYDRIKDLARREDVDAALIFGPAIAHEIGHLLMPTRQHARSGVLTGEWQKEEVISAVRGQMVFTAQERELIRADVVARTRELGGR